MVHCIVVIHDAIPDHAEERTCICTGASLQERLIQAGSLLVPGLIALSGLQMTAQPRMSVKCSRYFL